MAYTDIYRFAVEDGTTEQRMTVAVAMVAQDVLAEDGATPDHATRLTWARAALANPTAMGKKMVWAVLADPVIIAAGVGATDAQIKTAVAARVTDFSLA
jgi:hypothetical protein